MRKLKFYLETMVYDKDILLVYSGKLLIKLLSCNLQFIIKIIILVLNSTVTFKDNQNNNCMKNINVDQNDLDEIILADNDKSNEKSNSVYLK